MNNKGYMNLTTGILIRLLATVIIILSLPFLVSNPASIIAQIIFAFGNFMLVIGANIK